LYDVGAVFSTLVAQSLAAEHIGPLLALVGRPYLWLAKGDVNFFFLYTAIITGENAKYYYYYFLTPVLNSLGMKKLRYAI